MGLETFKMQECQSQGDEMKYLDYLKTGVTRCVCLCEKE